FFVPFIMVTAFAVLNLFIGIIVSGMQQDVEAEAAASRDAMLEEQTSMHEDIKQLSRDVKALSAALGELKKN
ncbi:MAG: ion transporter, partial [Pseudomonadota bacterium]